MLLWEQKHLPLAGSLQEGQELLNPGSRKRNKTQPAALKELQRMGRMLVEMLIVKRCHGVYGASAEHAEEGGERGI